jgi:hypothetical protein
LRAITFVLVSTGTIFMTNVSSADQEADSPKKRQERAVKMFQERCKNAGVKIARTVDDVEGVFLLKVRPESEETNYADQFRMNDPYGHDSAGDWFIKKFFLETYLFANRYASAKMTAFIRDNYKGYRWVEAIDPKDGKRYRYTGAIKAVGKQDVTAYNVQVELKRNPNYDLNIYNFVLEKSPATGEPPRYGVTYDDISTREEREYWIAGSSLKVVDSKTGEVIAERIGYMMDWAQGSRAGGRSPWLLAADNACPAFPGTPSSHAEQNDQTRYFVVRVLKPIQGN